MNSQTCEIIQDLLPLYCDGVCSEESRQLIQSHVRGCARCREELRLMSLPVNLEENTVEVNAVEAASRVWKKNTWKAFRRGIGMTLALLLFLGILGIGYFLGHHYRESCADGDWASLRDVLSETNGNAKLSQVETSVQKGSYLAIACCDENGLWHVGVFMPDSVFSSRWVCIGSLGSVRPGKLASWNCKMEGDDTVLVCFGAELPEKITGYTFSNSGVTYICPVEGNSVLDFFFVPDAYDAYTRLEPIYEP